MSAPYTKEFEIQLPILGLITVTSIVIDLDEFEALCDELKGVFSNGKPTTEDVAMFKQNKHIPLMKRGTALEFLYQRYNIKTDYVGVIVRGAGPSVIGY